MGGGIRNSVGFSVGLFIPHPLGESKWQHFFVMVESPKLCRESCHRLSPFRERKAHTGHYFDSWGESKLENGVLPLEPASGTLIVVSWTRCPDAPSFRRSLPRTRPKHRAADFYGGFPFVFPLPSRPKKLVASKDTHVDSQVTFVSKVTIQVTTFADTGQIASFCSPPFFSGEGEPFRYTLTHCWFLWPKIVQLLVYCLRYGCGCQN